MFDTAGQEDYSRLRPFSYGDTDVMLICFALDNPDSLENVLLNWLPEVRYFCGNVPILLVGNKKDLRRLDASSSPDTPNPETFPTDPIEAASAASGLQTPEEEEEEEEKRFPTASLLKYEEGLAVARKIDAVGYFETSAKTGEGTDAVFETVVRTGMETKFKKPRGLFRFKKT